MFEIKDVDFKDDSYGIEKYLYNWPMVYILENGKNAYVGQTTNIMKRMAQHKMADSKKEFTKAHFIYSEKFNLSATFDYESKLIGLMAADERFVLTNQNIGLAGTDYYDKNSYDEDFCILWDTLQKKHLANHAIEELQQSDLFKYSPYKELSVDQRSFVAEIMDSLRHGIDRKIVINGMPGSGKTVLAIYLFKLLRESPEFRNLKIGFIVPPTSLRETMKKVFGSINHLSAKDVIGPNDAAEEKYDILLVDEAHRLKRRQNLADYKSFDATCAKLNLPTTSNQMDWIMNSSRCVIAFYDRNQLVFPAGLEIDKCLNNDSSDTRMLAYYSLTSQMRCKGGTGYMADLKGLLYGRANNHLQYDNYEFCLIDRFAEFMDVYRKKETDCGLTRMLAGYAWNWESKTQKECYDITIDGISLRWNTRLKNWVHSPNAVNEVGCIHSIQGYDLNYAFVIIGGDLIYDRELKTVTIDKNSYFDRYGKIGADDKELEEFIKNIYYVLMTRGIKGTYLYVCDEALREYLAQYVDVIE